jgi:small subunit ribosomal protein S4
MCRRLGECVWGNPKCPSVKRPFAAGPHGKTARKKKLSTYGEMLVEKQKMKMHYGLTEQQMRITYLRAKKGLGMTNEKLFKALETRLDAVVFRSGLTPSIFAAKQAVTHGHILVNGKKVDRPSAAVKPGDSLSINQEKSPAIAENAKKTNLQIPGYIEVDKENVKATLLRVPEINEIPLNVQSMRVIEFYSK